MSRASLPLHVTVASSCPASWEEMEGNDRVRSCDQCQLQVYNLSAMSQQEAEDLLGRSVPTLRVGQREPRREPRQFAILDRRQNQMPVVRHHAIGQQWNRMLVLRFAQHLL